MASSQAFCSTFTNMIQRRFNITDPCLVPGHVQPEPAEPVWTGWHWGTGWHWETGRAVHSCCVGYEVALCAGAECRCCICFPTAQRVARPVSVCVDQWPSGVLTPVSPRVLPGHGTGGHSPLPPSAFTSGLLLALHTVRKNTYIKPAMLFSPSSKRAI